MGMYDNFLMGEIEMPDGKFYDEPFQSKGLDCTLDLYKVTRDGRLVVKACSGYDDEGLKYFSPTKVTATISLNGDIDVQATFSQGQLVALEMQE
jgi:hypothetical protein